MQWLISKLTAQDIQSVPLLAAHIEKTNIQGKSLRRYGNINRMKGSEALPEVNTWSNMPQSNTLNESQHLRVPNSQYPHSLWTENFDIWFSNGTEQASQSNQEYTSQIQASSSSENSANTIEKSMPPLWITNRKSKPKKTMIRYNTQ